MIERIIVFYFPIVVLSITLYIRKTNVTLLEQYTDHLYQLYLLFKLGPVLSSRMWTVDIDVNWYYVIINLIITGENFISYFRGELDIRIRIFRSLKDFKMRWKICGLIWASVTRLEMMSDISPLPAGNAISATEFYVSVYDLFHIFDIINRQ